MPWDTKTSPAYRGELSTVTAKETPWSVYVSTEDSAQGDVYISRSDPDGLFRQRITCDNSAVEFHPVMSPDGTMVAYASDVKGSFDIWLVRITSTRAKAADCPAAQQLTTSAAADTWPAWTPDSASVIFSSTRQDPLGDLFRIPIPVAGRDPGGSPEGRLIQLTTGPEADTHPAVHERLYYEEVSTSWVIFTTTEFERTGSLAALQLSGPPVGARGVFSLWPALAGSAGQWESAVGGTEAAWSPNGKYLAFTSTRHDAQGDVLVARLGFAEGVLQLVPSELVPVAANPGTPESHAAWLSDYNPAAKENPAAIAYTARIAGADVSDAVAADGSGHRTIAAATYDRDRVTTPMDEAGPAYSPDGTQLVWSRDLRGGNVENGRELVRARADGTEAAPQRYERRPEDVDTDPVWSPDGTRIAFTRRAWNGETYEDPATWVVDLGSEKVGEATAPARRVSSAPPAGVRYGEEDPAWSPDGSFLAVSRRFAPDLKVEVKVPGSSWMGQDIGVSATVTNVGPVSTDPTEVILTLPSGVVASPVPQGCMDSTGVIKCPVGALAPGATSPHRWTLRGTVSGAQSIFTSVPMPADVNPANNAVTSVLEISRVVDLEVSLSAVWVRLGLEATATVTNRGERRAGTGTLTFTTTGNLAFASPCLSAGRCSDGCQWTPESVTCPVESLSPTAQSKRTITLQGTVPSTRTSPSKGTVRAVVTKDDAEFETANNTADITVQVPEQIIERSAPTEEVAPSRPESGVRPMSWQGPAAGDRATAARPAVPPAPLFVAPTPRLEPVTAPPEVWVLNTVTGEANVLTAPGSCTDGCRVPGAHPAWSPDGSRIMVSDQGTLLAVSLKDDDAAGGPDVPHAAASLTAVTGFDAAGAPTSSRAELSSAGDPAWSPDGTAIFFTGQPAGQPAQPGIFAVAPDGTKLRTVVQGRGPETQPALQPWADLAVRLASDPATISKDQTATLKAIAVNNGPSPASPMSLLIETPEGLTALNTTTEGCSVSARSVTCRPDKRLEKGATVNVDVQVKGDSGGEHTSTATISAATPDPQTADNQSNTRTTMKDTVDNVADVSVDLTLVQTEGWAGGQPATGKARVTNHGPGATAAVGLKVSTAGSLTLEATDTCRDGTCSLDSLASGASRELDLKFTMPASNPTGGVSAQPAEVTVEASTSTTDPTPENNVDRAVLTVRQPGVIVYPAVGKPGDVVTIVVQGLPGNAKVRLAWSKGILADASEITAEGNELRRGLLLVRRDQLGMRDIIISSADNEVLFGEIRAPVLVVARPVAGAPSDFIGRG